MAGLGESCSHVRALNFKLEAAATAGFTKKTCTDVSCIWSWDFVTKIKPDKIAKIKIYSQKAIDNSKKSEPKAISFSGTNAKSKNENMDLLFPDCQSSNVNQLYYIPIHNIWKFLFKV